MQYLSFNPEKMGDSKLCSDVQISSDTLKAPNPQEELSVTSSV